MFALHADGPLVHPRSRNYAQQKRDEHKEEKPDAGFVKKLVKNWGYFHSGVIIVSTKTKTNHQSIYE